MRINRVSNGYVVAVPHGGCRIILKDLLGSLVRRCNFNAQPLDKRLSNATHPSGFLERLIPDYPIVWLIGRPE